MGSLHRVSRWSNDPAGAGKRGPERTYPKLPGGNSSRCRLSRHLIRSSSRGSRRQARTTDRTRASEIEAEHSCGVSACDLGQRCFVYPVYPCDMSDWIIFGHVERVVGAHHDTIGAEDIDQIRQLVIAKDYSVEIDLPQIGRRRQWQLAMRILPRSPSVIDPARITGKIAATVHGH